jgi:hypothetical protein
MSTRDWSEEEENDNTAFPKSCITVSTPITTYRIAMAMIPQDKETTLQLRQLRRCEKQLHQCKRQREPKTRLRRNQERK